MDGQDRLERPVRFLARNVTSKSVLKYARLGFGSSLLSMSLSVASLAFGLVVDMYIYSTVANALPGFLPLAIFECVRHSQYSVRLLKTQNLLALLLIPAGVILDCLILGYLGTIYSMCYGANNEKCVQKTENRYVCETSLPGLVNSSDLYCDSRRTQVIGLICVAINLLSFLSMLPYMLICRRLKSAFARIEGGGRGEARLQVPPVQYPEPIVLSVLGQPISSQEAESSIEIAYPANPKSPLPYSVSEAVSVQVEQ